MWKMADGWKRAMPHNVHFVFMYLPFISQKNRKRKIEREKKPQTNQTLIFYK